jgi:hypothetical protein
MGAEYRSASLTGEVADRRACVTGQVAWQDRLRDRRGCVTGEVAWQERLRDRRGCVTGEVAWQERLCDRRGCVTGEVADFMTEKIVVFLEEWRAYLSDNFSENYLPIATP